MWTVLSDNRSDDSRLSIEHGLSILLDTERHKILLDTGASDVFIRNAEQLGIDLSDVDYVFISHGHSDHAGGLRYFLEHHQKAQVIVSPDAMSGKFRDRRRQTRLDRPDLRDFGRSSCHCPYPTDSSYAQGKPKSLCSGCPRRLYPR